MIASRIWVLLLASFLFGCGQPRQQLNLLIWPDVLDPKVVAEFEERFNCRVTVDRFDNPEAMMTKLAGGGVSTYDLVMPSNTTLPIMVKRGLLRPLRWSEIPNRTNLDPEFTNPPFDQMNQYGVPYAWGTTGLFIRRPQGRAVEETWGLIFDPAKQLGPFLLLGDMRPCLGAALRYKGFSSNTTNREELIQARDLLIDAKKRSLGFESSLGCKNRVLAKGAVLGMAYTEVLGSEEDAETFYFVPKEGSEIWWDLLSIPAQAPHAALAEKFLNYFLEARIAARNCKFTRNATPNRAALEFLDPKDRNNPAIYPPPEIRQRLEFNQDLGEVTPLYDEIWTQVKAR